MRRLVSLFFVAAVLATAGTPALPQKQLDAWVAHWQHVLQLDDWRIAAIAVHIDDLPDGTAGISRADRHYQELTIHVLDPADYGELAKRNQVRVKTGAAILRDIEDTVLHELMHLRLEPLSGASQNDLQAAEELVVVRLTTALLGKH